MFSFARFRAARHGVRHDLIGREVSVLSQVGCAPLDTCCFASRENVISGLGLCEAARPFNQGCIGAPFHLPSCSCRLSGYA